MKKFILIFGPQGSGKSTQAKLLAEHLGYAHVSSGGMLRDMKDKNVPLSEELSKYWLKGELVPDELIQRIIFQTFETSKDEGFVMEGFPRNLLQLNAFLDFVHAHDWMIVRAYYVMVSEEECLNRIRKRIEIEHREDEDEDSLKKRLYDYYSKTVPVIEEFEKMSLLTRVDGEDTVENISSEIKSDYDTN